MYPTIEVEELLIPQLNKHFGFDFYRGFDASMGRNVRAVIGLQGNISSRIIWDNLKKELAKQDFPIRTVKNKRFLFIAVENKNYKDAAEKLGLRFSKHDLMKGKLFRPTAATFMTAEL